MNSATYRSVLEERFPSYEEVRAELSRPVPPPPLVYRPVRSTSRLTRLEELLLAQRSAAWRVARGLPYADRPSRVTIRS